MKKLSILSRLNKQEVFSKHPLVEITGTKRVLIENHQGVIGYSPEEIQIKEGYGVLSVTGRGLTFIQLNREKLVISGQIDGVLLLRR